MIVKKRYICVSFKNVQDRIFVGWPNNLLKINSIFEINWSEKLFVEKRFLKSFSSDLKWILEYFSFATWLQFLLEV